MRSDASRSDAIRSEKIRVRAMAGVGVRVRVRVRVTVTVTVRVRVTFRVTVRAGKPLTNPRPSAATGVSTSNKNQSLDDTYKTNQKSLDKT
jgi:hypothetical protein